MKNIVSVSLGSSERDHKVEAEIIGEKFHMERIGTDGDLTKAISILKSFDGYVDAFGIGGTDLYIHAGKRRYMLRDGRKMAESVNLTPIVDGSGLKNTLERKVISQLDKSGSVKFEGKIILMVCAADRFGMAEEIAACGGSLILGDLIFGLGIPRPLYSLQSLDRVARIAAPLISRLPSKYIYPSGGLEYKGHKKAQKYYSDADIIAGDFHYIKKYLPERLEGKIIITNTVTQKDVNILKQAGISKLITTTPEFDGRSFGTNVMEAVLVALLNKPVPSIKPEDYSCLLDEIGFGPRILNFNEDSSYQEANFEEVN